MANNGSEVLQGILDRVNSITLIPVNEKRAESATVKEAQEQSVVDPAELIEQMKTAARTLGDGESDNGSTHVVPNEGLEHGPEKDTDPVAEATKGPELWSNIKNAVYSRVDIVDEKIASASGATRKALAIGVPLAALGGGVIGYAGGRYVGEQKDRKNNQAYYEAGIYTAAQQLAKQIGQEMKGGQ